MSWGLHEIHVKYLSRRMILRHEEAVAIEEHELDYRARHLLETEFDESSLQLIEETVVRLFLTRPNFRYGSFNIVSSEFYFAPPPTGYEFWSQFAYLFTSLHAFLCSTPSFRRQPNFSTGCLLYTSDAADE